MQEADLHGADLSGADLSESNLSRANLREANLHETNLREATLREADLRYAHLIQAVLEKADLAGCAVYGISAWDVRLDGATQDDLVISRPGDPVIRADRLEVSQFIYLLLNYSGLDAVIDEMTSKVVLVMGHFIADRKAVLEIIREELGQRGYLTLSLAFGTTWSRDFTRTVEALVRLSRFIIVDITESRGVHPAVGAIAPFFDAVPTRVLLQGTGADEDVTGETMSRLAPVAIHRYTGLADLRASFDASIVAPAEAMREERSSSRGRRQRRI
ncbi:Pentapeptide repeat protein (fragment) [Nitrolancea hollandica Lb]|uniref:Pentapeptide repeat protein n=1 Tax=Nitrolancea hollandica Lb TaxID=1129897 RepID=I4EHL6_9BACT